MKGVVKNFQWFWIFFLVWVILLSFFSLIPVSVISLESGRDKVIHFLLYLPFGIIGWYHPKAGWTSLFLVSLFGANLGLLLELLQRKVGRVCDGWDFFADTLGVVSGLFLLGVWLILTKGRRRWQKAKESADARVKS